MWYRRAELQEQRRNSFAPARQLRCRRALVARRRQLVDRLRQPHVAFAEPVRVMGRQDDLDSVVDVEDLGMVIHLLGGERDARQKPPGLGEIAGVIALADRVAILDLAPAMQLAQRRLARRAGELLDHAALPGWPALASAPRRRRGQAGAVRR